MIAPDGVLQIIAGAANIRIGENPEYTADDFLLMYPQFGAKKQDGVLGISVVPSFVIDAWVKVAHASINKARYRDMWEIAMGFFIAHYLTLYLQTAANPNDPLGKIVNAGLAKGLQTSKSVSDISTSYDFGTVAKDFDGWGTYKQTAFGQQFITIARMVSIGGMVVW